MGGRGDLPRGARRRTRTARNRKSPYRTSFLARRSCGVQSRQGARVRARNDPHRILAPYKIALDQGGNCNAPADVDQLLRCMENGSDTPTPDGVDLDMWKPLRFQMGDDVACNMGEKGWVAGKVTGRNVTREDWTEGRVAPYEVTASGVAIYVPSDTDQFVRKIVRKDADADADAKAMMSLRFKVEDMVVCNMGKQGWLVGKVAALRVRNENWPAGVIAPYGVVSVLGHEIFVPKDSDECIRSLDIESMPPLRFKIGEEVQCNMGEAAGGWVAGKVVKTCQATKGKMAVYVVERHDQELTDQPIYVPMDHDQFVRSVSDNELSS